MEYTPLSQERKSQIHPGEIYFWTATIHNWLPLLGPDQYKDVIIQSLQFLSDAGKIDVYAFVIMPNHLHLIWKINAPNGKESPHGSFLKYTAHEFKKMLRKDDPHKLTPYSVNLSNKDYEFWQRDSLAIPLFTRRVALQKLKYMHYNPLAGKWRLVIDPCDYKYSSAGFYERGDVSFPFLKNLFDVL